MFASRSWNLWDHRLLRKSREIKSLRSQCFAYSAYIYMEARNIPNISYNLHTHSIVYIRRAAVSGTIKTPLHVWIYIDRSTGSVNPLLYQFMSIDSTNFYWLCTFAHIDLKLFCDPKWCRYLKGPNEMGMWCMNWCNGHCHCGAGKFERIQYIKCYKIISDYYVIH